MYFVLVWLSSAIDKPLANHMSEADRFPAEFVQKIPGKFFVAKLL